jgi:hypothetical protein
MNKESIPSSPKVLLIESDGSRIVAATKQLSSCDVTVARGRRQALEALTVKRFDIILMNLRIVGDFAVDLSAPTLDYFFEIVLAAAFRASFIGVVDLMGDGDCKILTSKPIKIGGITVIFYSGAKALVENVWELISDEFLETAVVSG